MTLYAVLTIWSTLAMSGALLAQNDARVTGTALNPYEFSEAVVPGVRIVFTAGDVHREVITDNQGRYEIRLPEGVYEVSGGRPGFCPINRPSLRVTASAETLINVRLIVCSIADGAEVGKNGKVIREVEWLVSPMKNETRTVPTAAGNAREVRFEYATRTMRGRTTEYKGSVVGRDNISAAAVYGVLAIYADSIFVDEESKLLRAAGHVTAENGRTRRHAAAATINLASSDVIASVTLEGESK